MIIRITIKWLIILCIFFTWEKEIIGSIHCMSLHEYNNQHNLLWSQH